MFFVITLDQSDIMGSYYTADTAARDRRTK